MTNEATKMPLSQTPLHDALKAKSRQRRHALAELGKPTPHLHRNDLLPQLTLIECALADLVLPTRNVRKIEAAHAREVATAISSFGFCNPILIDEKNTVLDGVVRVEAAKLLGLSEIPCIRAGHLTSAERRLLRMALNRLNEKGAWNLDELKLELEELILEDAPIEIVGFSMPEIDQIIIGDDVGTVETGPLAPEPEESLLCGLAIFSPWGNTVSFAAILPTRLLSQPLCLITTRRG
jgi:hypothetical protein